jgi:hypothetical protein
MSGLARICKMYGGLQVSNGQGVTASFKWDYANDCDVKEEDMPQGSDRWKASEKAKWEGIQRERQSEQNATAARAQMKARANYRRQLAAQVLASTDYPLDRIENACQVSFDMREYTKDRVELTMALVLPGPQNRIRGGRNFRSYARKMTTCGLSLPDFRRSFGAPQVGSLGDRASLSFVIAKLTDEQISEWAQL